MMRSKSPFKKKSPKERKEEIVADDSHPPMRHWTSVQEFQEFRKEQHLLSGNAFAQKRASRERSGTIGESFFPESPMTSMGQFIDAGRHESTTLNSKTSQSMLMKTPKKKNKNAPPRLNLVPTGEILKLVPDGAKYAVPTQREKNESTRHKEMEDMMYDAIGVGSESAAQSFVSIEPEKIKRPKSPGKKFFDFFKGGASSPKAPETPEIPATYKAAKVLGDESLGKKKGRAIAAAQKKMKKDGFDFKCSGPTPNIGGDSFDAPTDREIRITADHTGYSPTDLDIRKVGGRGTIVPMLSTQRTVSDTATVISAGAATVNAREVAAKHSSEIFIRTKSLQYMNDSLPPTPPSKESIKTRVRQDSIKNRALVTDYPPRSISTVPEVENSSPDTPNTAVLTSPTPLPKTTPLPKRLAKFAHNDYADLVLNNMSSIASLQASIGDTESVSPFMHNLSRDTSAEMLMDSYLDSENNVAMKSSGNNSVLTRSRNGSLAPSFVPSVGSFQRRLSRRWSDGSMLSSVAQTKMLGVPEVLRPGFYSPANFQVAGFKPSHNRDTSVFVLPKGSPNTLGYQTLESSSSNKISPSSTVSSSFASDTYRSASIAIGLGVTLSPLLASALNMTSDMSPGSDVQASFPNGHPSAMPAPLRFSQQSRASTGTDDGDLRSPLPAGQTLDAYLVLHNHIDRSAWATQEAVIREASTVNDRVLKIHHDNLKQLSTMFGDVMDKVKAIENETVRTAEGVERSRSDVIAAVEAMGAAMQKNLVKPMDKLFQSNTTLVEKVESLYGRLDELEKHTKANTDALASFQPPQQQNMSLGSRPGTMYSTASLDSANANPCENVQGAVSPPYAGVPLNGPPGLSHPSSGYYTSYGPGHPSNWNGGYVFNQGAIKDFNRDQRQLLFGNYGDTQMQANGGNMQTHPAFRNNNGLGQSQ